VYADTLVAELGFLSEGEKALAKWLLLIGLRPIDQLQPFAD
jgi:hypothetical protein